MREFDPAHVMLKHGQMPEEIIIVIQGEIQVLGLMRQFAEEEEKKMRISKGDEVPKNRK